MGLILIAGIATAFSFIVIKFKLEKRRWADATLDLFIMIVAGALFAGTLTGMSIAMIASSLVSIYLWFFPPKLDVFNEMFEDKQPKRKKKKKKKRKKRN